MIIREIRRADKWMTVGEISVVCNIRRESVIRCVSRLSTKWDILVKGENRLPHCIYRMNPKYMPNPQNQKP